MKLKNYINEEDILFEEITVGRVEDKYIIKVYEEPLGNPSFHVKSKTGDIECVYQIRDFNLLEKKTKKEFSNKELKEIKEWLREPSKIEKLKENSNWDVIIISWNLLNEKFRI